MKTKLLISLLILFSSSVFAQIPKHAISIEDKEFDDYFLTKENIPVVKGKIINLTAEEIRKNKIKYSIVTPFHDLQDVKTRALNADGSFELKLDYAFPYQQVWINFGELFYTGIYANADLYIELDADLLRPQKKAMFICPGVKYLGKDGTLNTYLNNHILFKREQQLETDHMLSELRYKKLNYPVYRKKYDSLYSILNKLDDDFIKQNPSDFSWAVVNERQSQYYGNLCAYHWRKQMPAGLFENVKKHKAYLISNDGMLFYQYLFMYLTIPPVGKESGNLVSVTLKSIKNLDSLFTPSKSDFLKIKFSSDEPDEQKILSETVLAHIKTTWSKSVIQEEYNKSFERLVSIGKTLDSSTSFVSGNQLGQPLAEFPFGAKLYRVDTLNAKTLLSNIKNSFQNKAVFIDLWSTWCAPCLKEFPYSKKLQEDTRDLPIEFVYICTSEGSSPEKWKTKIADFKLRGTHIYVDESIANKLLEMFSGNGFPTYVLLNAKGKYKPGEFRPSYLDKGKISELIKE